MNDDYCLTYFRVMLDSNFDLKDFCNKLNLDYENQLRFSTDKHLEIGRNEMFNIDLNIMLRESIKDLIGKEDTLLELKKKYNLEFYLERVVHLHADTTLINPILSLDLDIIEFIYKTKTIDDLDYYIY